MTINPNTSNKIIFSKKKKKVINGVHLRIAPQKYFFLKSFNLWPLMMIALLSLEIGVEKYALKEIGVVHCKWGKENVIFYYFVWVKLERKDHWIDSENVIYTSFFHFSSLYRIYMMNKIHISYPPNQTKYKYAIYFYHSKLFNTWYKDVYRYFTK